MKTVIYQGRVVPAEHFRTYVYNKHGEKKLVNSYTEYELTMQSEGWYEKKPLIVYCSNGHSKVVDELQYKEYIQKENWFSTKIEANQRRRAK